MKTLFFLIITLSLVSAFTQFTAQAQSGISQVPGSSQSSSAQDSGHSFGTTATVSPGETKTVDGVTVKNDGASGSGQIRVKQCVGRRQGDVWTHQPHTDIQFPKGTVGTVKGGKRNTNVDVGKSGTDNTGTKATIENSERSTININGSGSEVNTNSSTNFNLVINVSGNTIRP